MPNERIRSSAGSRIGAGCRHARSPSAASAEPPPRPADKHALVGPAPVGRLGDAERDRADRARQQRAAEQVGRLGARAVRAVDEQAPRRQHAERDHEVHEERPAPAAGVNERAAETAPSPPRRRPPRPTRSWPRRGARRELGQHERERGGMSAAAPTACATRAPIRNPTSDADPQEPSPPGTAPGRRRTATAGRPGRPAAGRHERRREDAVVGVQDPGELAQRRLREVQPWTGRDVDDRHVEEGHEDGDGLTRRTAIRAGSGSAGAGAASASPLPVRLGVDDDHRARAAPHLLGDRGPEAPEPRVDALVADDDQLRANALGHRAQRLGGPARLRVQMDLDVEPRERGPRLLERAGHRRARRATRREGAHEVERHPGGGGGAPRPGAPRRRPTRIRPCR